MTYDGPWWPPESINFGKAQIIFLVENYTLLCDIKWPLPPKNSGYTEIEGLFTTGRVDKKRKWAPFEKIADVLAELDERMRFVGEDSSILRDLYTIQMSPNRAAFIRGITRDELLSRRDCVLDRMSKCRR